MANTTVFARWLRERRAEVQPELSQAELARQAGVSKNYVSRLERTDAVTGSQPPIDNPGEGRIDALSRVLERYLRRPLVNEARRVLGYPLLADEATPPDDVGPSPDDHRRAAQAMERILAYSPQKRRLVFEVLEAIDNDERPKSGDRERVRPVAAMR